MTIPHFVFQEHKQNALQVSNMKRSAKRYAYAKCSRIEAILK